MPRRSTRLPSLILLGVAAVCTSACQSAGPAGPADEASYAHGAKFEPPEGRVLHGMGQWEEYNTKLLGLLPAPLHPAAELVFVDIGDTPRGWRPEQIAATLAKYDQQGVIPQIDIALRGLQPFPSVLDTMQDKLYGIDDEVATTTAYDARINDLVQVVRAFRKPVIVRIGGEFNGSWNGYHPWHFPRAFRKIVQLFRAGGADNAAFVWCYEPAGPDDFDEKNASGEHKWYPGADVIDWYAIDWFATADFTGPLVGGRRGEALSPHGRTRKFLDMAVADGKPVMIAESAPAHYDLSNPAQAEAAWQEWYLPYFAIIAERKEIAWFHLINYDWTRATYYQQTGWKNNDVTANATLLGRISAELAKSKYLHQPDKPLLKDYDRYR